MIFQCEEGQTQQYNSNNISTNIYHHEKINLNAVYLNLNVIIFKSGVYTGVEDYILAVL